MLWAALSGNTVVSITNRTFEASLRLLFHNVMHERAFLAQIPLAYRPFKDRNDQLNSRFPRVPALTMSPWK
jgi:hypothetical protein